MNAKRISKKVLEGMLIGTLALGSVKDVYAPKVDSGYTPEVHKQLIWDKLAKEQNADGMNVPYIPTPANYCARYAVLSADKLFDKEYKRANAWDLKYSNPVIYDFSSEKDVRNAILEEKLVPGMLVTSRWPVKNIRKYGRRGFDIKGNPVNVTHVVEYVGIGKNTSKGKLKIPEPLFLHQWGSVKEILTQKQLYKNYKLEFVEGINDKELPGKEKLETFPERFM